jgi:uncharacterized protein (TIGR03000 family)
VFCGVFPCHCHGYQNSWRSCSDPCFDFHDWNGATGAGSWECCSETFDGHYSYSVSPTSPVSPAFPSTVAPAPAFPRPDRPTAGPNISGSRQNTGNFYQNPLSSPATSPVQRGISVPKRTPPESLGNIISTEKTGVTSETEDPASIPPTLQQPGGHDSGLPVPPTGIDFPVQPVSPIPGAAQPGGGSGKINLGSGAFSITVPENAKVYINGYETKQTGTTRTYISKDLIVGQDYRYEIRVVAERNGQRVEETKSILLTADEYSLLTFAPFHQSLQPSVQIAAKP